MEPEDTVPGPMALAIVALFFALTVWAFRQMYEAQALVNEIRARQAQEAP